MPPSLSIAVVPMLLVLAACVHGGSGSRAAAPARSAAVPATPAPPASAPTGAASTSAPALTPPAAPAEAPNTAAPPPPGIRSRPTATKVPPAKAASLARAGPTAPAAAGANTTRPAAAAPAASLNPTRPAAAAPAASAAALDLTALEQRLRDTHAIGVFTKLSLKNQVDDLLAQFKAFYRGQSEFSLAQLRQNYEVLLLKVVSVLQDGDPALARTVSSSREAIWAVLKDPRKFAAI